MPTPFAIEAESPRPEANVLKLLGELDLAVADKLQAALEATAATETVVIDLAECEFIDSTGLAVMIRAHQRHAGGGGRLVLCSPSQQVKRILEMSGLTRDGFVVADREQALAG